MKTINSLDDVPDFASEAQEAEYWGTHAFSKALLDSLPELDPFTLKPVKKPGMRALIDKYERPPATAAAASQPARKKARRA